MSKRSWKVALDLSVLAVAAHSIVGGLLLLVFPLWILKLVGWDYAGPAFWPSQAGLFLALLGGVYAAGTRLRPLLYFLIISKGCALVFLLLSLILLDAPRVVLMLGIGDGLMGLLVALMLWKQPRIASIL